MVRALQAVGQGAAAAKALIENAVSIPGRVRVFAQVSARAFSRVPRRRQYVAGSALFSVIPFGIPVSLASLATGVGENYDSERCVGAIGSHTCGKASTNGQLTLPAIARLEVTRSCCANQIAAERSYMPFAGVWEAINLIRRLQPSPWLQWRPTSFEWTTPQTNRKKRCLTGRRRPA